MALADGGRLYESLRRGRSVLITPGGHDDPGTREERLTVERWAGGRRTTVLVRPEHLG